MTHALLHNGFMEGGPSLSRRDFIRGAGAGLAGALLMGSGLMQHAAPSVPASEPVTLLRSTFASHIGDRFHLRSDLADPLTLTLFKLRDLRFTTAGAHPSDPDRSFSLLFSGPSERRLAQATYDLEHRQLGSFGLLLVPMRPEPGVYYYEAIVNHWQPQH